MAELVNNVFSRCTLNYYERKKYDVYTLYIPDAPRNLVIVHRTLNKAGFVEVLNKQILHSSCHSYTQLVSKSSSDNSLKPTSPIWLKTYSFSVANSTYQIVFKKTRKLIEHQ